MEYEITYNINLSNERFISSFNNRIDERQNQYIINYIYSYNNHLQHRPLASQEITLPTFIAHDMLIPNEAQCGISFEQTNCITSCGHYFCREEITRWLEQQKNEMSKMTCPTCRTEITTVVVAKNK